MLRRESGGNDVIYGLRPGAMGTRRFAHPTDFVKAPYGPYAENLRHVLRDIEGHLISGYADGGDAPDKQLALVPGAVDDAVAFLESHAATHERFDRVVRLVEGFETPFGLELLVRVPAHDGHDSGAMADTVPAAWRTVFRPGGGHFRCWTGRVSAMISERCPR